MRSSFSIYICLAMVLIPALAAPHSNYDELNALPARDAVKGPAPNAAHWYKRNDLDAYTIPYCQYHLSDLLIRH